MLKDQKALYIPKGSLDMTTNHKKPPFNPLPVCPVILILMDIIVLCAKQKTPTVHMSTHPPDKTVKVCV